jgi:hypothetical protein
MPHVSAVRNNETAMAVRYCWPSGVRSKIAATKQIFAMKLEALNNFSVTAFI